MVEVAGNAIVGTVNEMTKGEVKVIDNPLYAKYVQNGTLTFADEDGGYVLFIPFWYIKVWIRKKLRYLTLILELGSVIGWQDIHTNKQCRSQCFYYNFYL